MLMGPAEMTSDGGYGGCDPTREDRAHDAVPETCCSWSLSAGRCL